VPIDYYIKNSDVLSFAKSLYFALGFNIKIVD
jgi:hypothetical protein